MTGLTAFKMTWMVTVAGMAVPFASCSTSFRSAREYGDLAMKVDLTLDLWALGGLARGVAGPERAALA